MSADRKGGSLNPSLRSLTAKAVALSIAWGHRHQNVLTVPRVATRHPHHRANERPTTEHRPRLRGDPSSTGHASFTRSNRGETEGESASFDPASTSPDQVRSGHLPEQVQSSEGCCSGWRILSAASILAGSALRPLGTVRGVFAFHRAGVAGRFSRRYLPAADAAGALRRGRLAVPPGGEPHSTPGPGPRRLATRRRSSSRLASQAPRARTPRTLPCSQRSTRIRCSTRERRLA